MLVALEIVVAAVFLFGNRDERVECPKAVAKFRHWPTYRAEFHRAHITIDCPSEDEAAAVIQRHGGYVDRDENLPGNPVVCAGFKYGVPTDEDMKMIKKFKRLRSFTVHGSIIGSTIEITDKSLCGLEDLVDLEELDLSLTRITDIGLNSLKDMKNLKKLNVRATDVTDDGVKKLKKSLPDLQILR